MKCMIGLFQPDEGQILYEGQDLTRIDEKEKKELRQQIGMLFQGSALFDSKTVRKMLCFPWICLPRKDTGKN